MLLLFGIHEVYDDWIEIRMEHFNFWFKDTSGFSVDKYISDHEEAFTTCNEFFRAKLPKRIDFFVWSSTDEALNTLFINPAFASPDYCCIHSNPNLTPWHEITHILSHFAIPESIKNKFIFEGIAVAFDQSNKNKEVFLRAFLKQKKIKELSIVSVWQNTDLYPKALYYSLGGILVEHMIEQFGREKFITFMKNQSYENALKVFGNGLDALIKQIENELY